MVDPWTSDRVDTYGFCLHLCLDIHLEASSDREEEDVLNNKYMASRRSSRSREDYRHARDPLDLDCRPVLCIRDDDCKISLKSYGGSEGINLSEIQNCGSRRPLKEARQRLLP